MYIIDKLLCQFGAYVTVLECAVIFCEGKSSCTLVVSLGLPAGVDATY